MKVIIYDRVKPGARLEMIQPYPRREVAEVWQRTPVTVPLPVEPVTDAPVDVNEPYDRTT
ncbi:hypothetical protein [Nocardia sp. NPDC057030]|uniref:hypothetical protein n=1 Tax=unclassified Nocardia TaxID=2637762 RepID=UPI0036419C22